MENGHVASNGDTGSGPHRDDEEKPPNGKAKPLLAPASASGHKRSLSGNILSFPFFGGSQGRQDMGPKPPIKTKATQAENLPPSPRSGKGAMASVMQQTKPRKRKGSLRKAALLGGKARRESSSEEHPPPSTPEPTVKPAHDNNRPDPTPPATPKAIHPIPPEVPSHTKPTFNLPPPHPLPLPPSTPALQATKPILHNEPLPVPMIPPKPFPHRPPFPASTSDSYFPPMPRPRYHQQSPLASSALAGGLAGGLLPGGGTTTTTTTTTLSSSSPQTDHPPLPLPQQQQQHDYGETRAWGWVLLATTWIVVVVGMGSCLGVWSWAWDVGETPYAPPELEDDPTLPIVGYYPALIILTGVMAWVWVVVAWVGMKYFRHATMGEG